MKAQAGFPTSLVTVIETNWVQHNYRDPSTFRFCPKSLIAQPVRALRSRAARPVLSLRADQGSRHTATTPIIAGPNGASTGLNSQARSRTSRSTYCGLGGLHNNVFGRHISAAFTRSTARRGHASFFKALMMAPLGAQAAQNPGTNYLAAKILTLYRCPRSRKKGTFMAELLHTVFGTYAASSRERLELTYDYETAAIFSFKKALSEIGASHLLDIGANIGVYSIFCSDLPLLKRIHAFEPAPSAFELLEQNIQIQSKASLFEAHRLAASSQTGTVAFKIISSLSGANAVVEDPSDCDNIIKVASAPLDTLVKLKGERIGIKIDVEGHEDSAIEGMKSILTDNQCYIQIECLTEEKRNSIAATLESYGYDYIFSLRDDHIFIHHSLEFCAPKIIRILTESLAFDLRDLLNLRREKRTAARKRQEIAVYMTDPLYLPQGQDPLAVETAPGNENKPSERTESKTRLQMLKGWIRGRQKS